MPMFKLLIYSIEIIHVEWCVQRTLSSKLNGKPREHWIAMSLNWAIICKCCTSDRVEKSTFPLCCHVNVPISTVSSHLHTDLPKTVIDYTTKSVLYFRNGGEAFYWYCSGRLKPQWWFLVIFFSKSQTFDAVSDNGWMISDGWFNFRLHKIFTNSYSHLHTAYFRYWLVQNSSLTSKSPSLLIVSLSLAVQKSTTH